MFRTLNKECIFRAESKIVFKMLLVLFNLFVVCLRN